ncbi:MAG: InlB B-repeat-containing protein [Faecalibacterium prausnitzii]|nr:InlB B-repeat-containing protein [Faecalibacterium prausnitzii]
MAGTGRIYVTAVRGVGDVNLTHKYDVDIRFDIAFDFGGYNYGGAPYSMSCDGQNTSGSAAFAVGSGGGQWIWTNIGGTKTFRITMPTSGQSKKIGFSATVNTGVNPATISASGEYTLSAITWEHTVSYNANGGTGAPDTQKKIYGSVLTLSSVRPTRDGYVFMGWATSSAGDVAYMPGATYGADADVTLYAVWQIAYIKPTITRLTALRCDSKGSPKSDGTYIKVTGSWQVDQTLNNSNKATSVRIDYQETASGSPVKASETYPNTTSGKISQVIGNGKISTGSVYFVIVTITDLNGSKQEEVIVPAQFRALDVANKGRSIAFGGTASDSEVGYDFYQDARFHGKLLLGDQELMGIKEYDSGQVRGPYFNVNSSNRMQVWLYKIGKIVHCKIEMLAQFPNSGSFNDFDEAAIPEEFRPKYHVFCACPEVVAGTIVGNGRYRIGPKISLDVENATYAERIICTSWISAI